MQDRPLKYIRLFRDKKLLALAESLQKKGAKIIVYSDHPAVKKLSVLRPFKADYVFSHGDPGIPRLKPDTAGLRHIINVAGEAVENMAFIGDRYNRDGLCAEAAGMDYVILGRSFVMRSAQLCISKGVMYG
jgi:FMN phosphatase YigB (HAD superfamily)